MEKPNFAVNNGVKLPIGYRFRPTDEELVVHYLKRKVFGVPLPASVIPELDVFQTDPWSLPGDLKEKRYFFTKKENESQRKCKKTAGSGYWRPLGKGKQIVASACSNRPVGTRRSLVFYEDRPSNQQETRTQWVMREYSLLNLATNPSATQKNQMKAGDSWVVYSLFQRKRRPKKHGVLSKFSKINKAISPSLMEICPPQPSSSCSSGVTEVASNELDQEEISSLEIGFSFPRRN